MQTYPIGAQVSAKLGTLPLVGTVVSYDEAAGQYLVRFSAVQQGWYQEAELTPFHPA